MFRLSENLHPALTSIVLNRLLKKSINTISVFARTNSELLAKISGLQYSEVLQVKDIILIKFSSSLRYGNKYYLEVLNHSAILSTSIANFDTLLDSGFVTGNIYELCGFAGCGKTQICMTVAVNISLFSHQQVFFVDTKNDISAQRLFEIIETHKVSNIGQLLQKIRICQVRNAYELLRELHKLEKKIKNTKETYLGFRLVIIDSLSALFQQFYNQNEGLSVLNNVANLLKFISVEYHLVILLTNFVTSWTVGITSYETENEDENQSSNFQQIQQPALGKYWVHVPNTRIMVKKLDGSNECFLIILKSLDHPVGKSIKIKLSDSGVS